MIECYFKWCNHHPKDEPFCGMDRCLATEEQIIEFRELRSKELQDMGYPTGWTELKPSETP